MTIGPDIHRFDSDDWSALYVNGELVSLGASHVVDGSIERLLAIKTIDDVRPEDWLLDSGECVATLNEVIRRRDARLEPERQAEALEAQARVLMAQAEALRRGDVT
jgi:hypothetical protein